jgi:hypothetical protein
MATPVSMTAIRTGRPEIAMGDLLLGSGGRLVHIASVLFCSLENQSFALCILWVLVSYDWKALSEVSLTLLRPF